MTFRNLSVGHKLMILMMAASSAALLLVCAVLLGYDVITSKRATAEHLSTLVQMIADNSKAALSFGDQEAAGEVLATLKAEPHITAACIYDKQGKPFALYHPKGEVSSDVPPLRSPGTYFGVRSTGAISADELEWRGQSVRFTSSRIRMR